MTQTKYEIFLNQFAEKDWLAAVERLLPKIHEVDRHAAAIWFRFYPLSLFRYLNEAEDRERVVRKFVLQGDYELKNQIDSSHRFLYGHRFWAETKAAIEQRAADFENADADLSREIEAVAQTVAEKAKTQQALALGIAAVGLMTLVQSGLDAFKEAAGAVAKPSGQMAKAPDRIVAERRQDDSQGLFGFLKTVDKKFTVSWNRQQSSGQFRIINDEDIASAAAKDQSRDWKSIDERCFEGVVPVECRSASCGTCWVGVLAGEEKLSEVERLERKQMKIFGYNQPDEAKPVLRLACQAKAFGNVTIVIPPWNGVFGKKVYDNVEEEKLEPATTSAKKTRTIVKEVTNGQ